MVKFSELTTKKSPNWCGGCGDFPILMAVKNAMAELGTEQEKFLLVSGIGCSSKLPYWVKTYAFNGLHGRPLPVATGAKLANHELTVIVIAGDGDGYGEGTSHFIHTARRNLNLTYVVHNNGVYGLTTGQTTPTTPKGMKTKSTPGGSIEMPFNPISSAIAAGATYVARGFSGDVKQMTKLIAEGVKHRGFALIDILQPCVTYNHINTYDFYKERCYKLEDENHDYSDKVKAFEKSLEWNSRIPTGLFYKEERPIFEDEVIAIQKEPLIKQNINNIDVTPLMESFK